MYYDPRNFCHAFKPNFNTNEQMDAEEFLNLLLDKLSNLLEKYSLS